jgi:hypothetical protein
MSDTIRLHPRALRRKAREKAVISQKKIRRWLKKAKLSETELSTALALLGIHGHAERILWSDVAARYKASKLFATLMAQHRAARPNTRTYYLITLIDDCGTTSDRTPNLALETMTMKAWRALNSMNLNAVGMLEVHPLMNYPGGKDGRSLILHGHAIAWADAPFNHRAAEAAFNASPAWTCSLGAKPVDIRPIDPAPGHIERVAHYLAKAAISVKNLMPKINKPGRFKMKDTTAGFRDGLASRLFEGQSQVELMSVMFGVGEGSMVRQAIRTELTRWHAARKGDVLVPKTFDVWAFWLAIRQRDVRTKYLPYRFVGGAYAPIVTVVPPKPAPKAATVSYAGPPSTQPMNHPKPTRPSPKPLMRLRERQALKRKMRNSPRTH